MISVVIPLYNKEQSILHTLYSVMCQTYTDWECVIVNDGSTDNSAKVVKAEIEKDCNKKYSIRLVNKENGGVSSARNMGVQEAKGEYIAFLDGDDLWTPTYLEELVKLINDFPNAAIYGLGYGKMVDGVIKSNITNLTLGFRGVVENIWDGHIMLYWTGASCCNKSRFIPFNENLSHGEDLDVWLRLMLSGPAVFYNKTLAYYVQDAENRAMNRVPAIEHHIVSVIDQYKEAREANTAFRKAFDTQMIYFLYEYMFTKYKSEAQRLAGLLDYSQLKYSLKFRMFHPYIYRALLKVKTLIKH